MTIKNLSTLLILLNTSWYLAACGPSPWSQYKREGGINPGKFTEKITGNCGLPAQAQISSWLVAPIVGNESVFEITTNRKLESPSVELWMPSMGHGSRPTTVSENQDGSYRVSNVYFIMYGDWEIRLKESGSTLCTFRIELTP